MKVCKGCGESKTLDDFAKNGKYHRPYCKPCYNARQLEYRQENSEQIREHWKAASAKYYSPEKRRNKTLRKYGLTDQTYNDMFDEQDGKCKICNKAVTLVVDHCHSTGKIRGLLCNPCNTSLGHFEDDIERLRKAIKYLSS